MSPSQHARLVTSGRSLLNPGATVPLLTWSAVEPCGELNNRKDCWMGAFINIGRFLSLKAEPEAIFMCGMTVGHEGNN